MSQSNSTSPTTGIQSNARSDKKPGTSTTTCSHSAPPSVRAVPPDSVTYFHGKITREQAEDLLFAHGCVEGLFLLRVSVGGNYVISICHENCVHHYNAERQQNGWYKIQSGRSFPGPVELVQHHTVHLDGFLTLARTALERENGATPLVLQGLRADELELKLRLKAAEMGLKGQSVDEVLSGPMRDHIRYLVLKELHTCQPWYHHSTGRREAEQRLMADGNREGAFLVRYREADGTYVLSLCSNSEPKHYKIEELLSRWSIEGGQFFETLIELIDHYHHRQDGLLCKLRRTVAAPAFARSPPSSMSALHVMDSPLPLPRVEDTGVQTSLAAGVNEWNRSQSPKAVSSTPLVSIGTHSESESPKTEIRQDLISFADWPNVTRLLSSSLNKQPAVHAQFAPSKEDNSNNPFPVTAFIPISTLTDPFANITSASGEFLRPLSSSHEPPLSSGISHASRISVNGAQTNKAHVATESLDRLTQRSDRLTVHFPSTTTVITSDCLQPIRIGDSPVCRAAADVDAAIASVLSAAFPPQTTSDEIATATVVFAGSSRNRTSAQPDQGSRFGPDNKSIKNAVQTTSPTIFPKLSLHLPPILDIPWEEPDVSDDVLECNQGKTTNSNGLTTVPSALDATSRAPTCFSNPFLTAPFNESIVHNIPMTHSPDVSTFCSAACCQHSSKPVVVAGRSAWADAFCQEDAQLVYDDLPPSNFLLDAQNVVLLERLGGGNFGHVVRGVYRTSTGQEVPVAVKTLKANQIAAVGEREILVEAKTMAQLRHRHIVRLIGVCKEEQFMLILELVPLGPINKYLKKRQDVSVHTLTELMHQVALGMAYLESCKFVHRDLAARNVLLVNRHFAKISDFGMSKALKFGSDYYRASTVGKWPLKWYAPECIYYFRFDTKSDVWSYGITLWEVYSYGERPYRGMKGAQILAMLDQGLRLSKPSRCPDSIYSIMQQCWNFDGARRPTFSDIVLAVSRVLSHLTMPSRNTHRIGESVRSIPNGSTFGQMRRSDTGTSGSGGSGVNSESSDRTSF